MIYSEYIYIGGIALLTIFTAILLFSLIVIKNKNKKLEERLSNRDEIANESYVRFLNESRDWAYGYIEDVQAKLKDFADEVEPQLDYFNTYGRAVASPHTIMLEKIDSAYVDLKSVLPQENEEKK
jgi:hypothetical protein